jgi:hypothetical protein
VTQAEQALAARAGWHADRAANVDRAVDALVTGRASSAGAAGASELDESTLVQPPGEAPWLASSTA